MGEQRSLTDLDDLKLAEGAAGSHFEGEVWRTSLLGADGVRATLMRFSAGTMTLWHRHAGGQMLQVVKGAAVMESEKTGREIVPEHAVAISEPGEWHRHGADESADLVQLVVSVGETEWRERGSEP